VAWNFLTLRMPLQYQLRLIVDARMVLHLHLETHREETVKNMTAFDVLIVLLASLKHLRCIQLILQIQ
jgi:hypothetical protein